MTEPKDRLSAWKKAAAKKAQPAGAADSVMQKAVQLNPNLKGGLKTDEFLDKAAEAQRQHAAKRAEPQQAPAPKAQRQDGPRTLELQAGPDLGTQLTKAKHFVNEEDTRIAAERATAVQQLAALEAQHKRDDESLRQRVVALFARVDPALTSPRTQALLAEQGAFLKALGLDIEKLRKEAQRGARR